MAERSIELDLKAPGDRCLQAAYAGEFPLDEFHFHALARLDDVDFSDRRTWLSVAAGLGEEDPQR